MPAIVPAVTAFVATLGPTALFVARILGSVLLSAVSQALQKKQRAPSQPGITSQFTGQGDTTPQSIILGPYATGGHQMCPYYTHSSDPGAGDSFGQSGFGDYATFVISLGDAPVTGLDSVYVDGVRFDLDTHLTGPVHPHYGLSVAPDQERDDYVGHVWVKFHDGTQTEADPYLVAAYGNHAQRPWKASSVHQGAPYVIVTLRRKQELFQSFSVDTGLRFVVRGMALEDPRTGQTGFTQNPAVMIWNLKRGISLPDGSSFGLGVDDGDLPDAWWFAAMDDCDDPVALADGSTEPAFRAGLEIPMATPDDGGMDALTAIDELALACQASLADLGGTWIIRVGAAQASVAAITDGDVLNSREQSYQPFQGLADTVNTITATWPNPDAKWEATEAARRSDEAAVAEDGEQLVQNLQLDPVPFGDQVQRIQISELRDARRARSHRLALPYGFGLTLLDALSLSSDLHGYGAKQFDVRELAVDLQSGARGVAVRETDPADFVVAPAEYVAQPVAAVAPALPAPVGLSSFDAEPYTITDGATARRPAIRLTWTLPSALFSGLAWRVMRADELVLEGSTAFPASGEAILSEGLLPDTSYSVTAQPVAAGVRGAASAPRLVRTPNVTLGVEDLSGDVWAAVQRDAQSVAARALAVADIEGFAQKAILGLLDAHARERKGRELFTVGRQELTQEISANGSAISKLQLDLAAGSEASLAAVQAESMARVLGDEALTRELTNLVATVTTQGQYVSQNTAAVASEVQARAQGDQVIASSIAGLSANLVQQGETITQINADVTSETQARVQGDQAAAASIEQLTTNVGEQSVTLTQQAETINGLGASIQFQIDNNGWLAGFALSSQVAAGGVPYSSFVFVADKFQLSSPNGGFTPFVTYTTPTTVNGVSIPAGTYIKAAAIQDAAIDEAKIKDATIGTAKIANGAVTNKFAEFTGSTINLTGAFKKLQEVIFDCNGQSVSVLVNFGLDGEIQGEFDIRLDGVSQRTFKGSGGYDTPGAGATQFYENMVTLALELDDPPPPAGNYAIALYGRSLVGGQSPRVRNIFMSTIENKR